MELLDGSESATNICSSVASFYHPDPHLPLGVLCKGSCIVPYKMKSVFVIIISKPAS